jgi:sugar lactone lactonase YvrE
LFLNGLTVLNKQDRTVLISDSGAGVVYRVDTHSGSYKVVLTDPLMKPLPPPAEQLGINGINVRSGVLYWTNTLQTLFARVPIHSDGTAAGPSELITRNGLNDDFTFDFAGTAYIGQNVANTLGIVTAANVSSTLVGNLNSTELVGPTAVQFGRTESDRSVLYVTTSGGLAVPVNGTYTEGGKVVAVKIS